MNRYISTSMLGTLFAISLSALPQAAVADDETISAYAGCRVELGNATGVGSALRAVGGTAVISCPILKNVGGNNLNHVFARIRRAQFGGADPFCTLSSYNAFNTSGNTQWTFATDPAGNKSLNLNLPATHFTGYLYATCVLNVNDRLYGIRYGQDG